MVLAVLILGAGIYNAVTMLMVRQGSAASMRLTAPTVTILDEVGCLVFPAIFTSLPAAPRSPSTVPVVVAEPFSRLRGPAWR